MSEVLRYVLPGRPVSWERKRIDTRPGRKPRVFTSDKQRAVKRAHGIAAIAALRAANLTGWPDADDRYEIEVYAYYPDLRHGDVDRAPGLPLDALEGVVYVKDRQVKRLVVEILDDAENPRTEVVVKRRSI